LEQGSVCEISRLFSEWKINSCYELNVGSNPNQLAQANFSYLINEQVFMLAPDGWQAGTTTSQPLM